jgi:hypothetical protein
MTSSEPYKYESRRLLDTIDGSAGIQSVPGSGSGPTPVLRKIVRYALIVAIILAAAYIVFTVFKATKRPYTRERHNYYIFLNFLVR